MKNQRNSIYEGCQGCSLYFSEWCVIRYNPKLIEKCPCRNCLVKMVCKTMCKERSRLYTDLSNRKKEHLQLTYKEETYNEVK